MEEKSRRPKKVSLIFSSCTPPEIKENPNRPVKFLGCAPSTTPYNFADQYNSSSFKDESTRHEYMMKVMRFEGNFHQGGVAYNAQTGLTYEGHPLDYNSGRLFGVARKWSAASKESLHINMLVMAVFGNQYAKCFLNSDDSNLSISLAVKLLEKKILSYENFNKEYPAFGGFLPWFIVSGNKMIPTNDCKDWVPSLDNGQLAWSVFLAAKVLREKGYTALADRYNAQFVLMSQNAVKIFYDGDGKIRAEAKIEQGSYSNNKANYYLDDPYEGELMTVFMDLFGQWKDPSEREKIWINKRAKLQTRELAVNIGNMPEAISYQVGHWFSSHEQWKYLVLPYQGTSISNRVFLNTEKARTWHSSVNEIPGLFASVNSVVTCNSNPDYVFDLGIKEFARVSVNRNDLVTPYAAFPTILANPEAGLAWYNHMIGQRWMQNSFGSSESINVAGTAWSPVLTWDAKVTSVLAMMGGTGNLIRRYLTQAELARFETIVRDEHSRVFTNIKGDDLPFGLPPNVKSNRGKYFPDQIDSNVLSGLCKESFQAGGGNIINGFKFENSSLELNSSKGYVFFGIPHNDITVANKLVIKCSVNSAGSLWLELKNNEDQLVTRGKIKVDFPKTSRSATFHLDISDTKNYLDLSKNRIGLIAFSDPSLSVRIESISFVSSAPQGSTKLNFALE